MLQLETKKSSTTFFAVGTEILVEKRISTAVLRIINKY